MLSLFLIAVSFVFGADAKLELVGNKSEQSVPVAHTLTFEIRPTEPVEGNFKKAVISGADNQNLAVLGPLILDQSSFQIQNQPLVLKVQGMLTKQGSISTPTFDIQLDGATTLWVKPLSLNASSALQPGDDKNPVWIWGLKDQGGYSWVALTVAAILLLTALGAVGYLLWKRWKKSKEDKRTPLERSRDQLALIINERQPKAFSYKLVAWLKNLLEARLGGSLTELTDPEIFMLLQQSQLGTLKAVERIFKDTYEIRYAQTSLTDSTRRELISLAEQIWHEADVYEKAKVVK